MLLIIMLLCSLAQSVISDLTKEPIMNGFSTAYETSGMLAKISFARVIGEALESMEEFEEYKPKETGKIDLQCAQILAELLSKLPTTVNEAAIVKAIGDMVRQAVGEIGYHPGPIDNLKQFLDQDYDRLMENINENIIMYKEMKNTEIPDEDIRKNIDYLISFFRGLYNLRRKRARDHTLEDSIRSVYRIYRALPKLSTLRSKFCDKSLIFDFAQENFIRHFPKFLENVEYAGIKLHVDQSELERKAVAFVNYYSDWLDSKTREAFVKTFTNRPYLMGNLLLTMAIALRPDHYFFEAEEYGAFARDEPNYYGMVTDALNLTNTKKKKDEKDTSHEESQDTKGQDEKDTSHEESQDTKGQDEKDASQDKGKQDEKNETSTKRNITEERLNSVYYGMKGQMRDKDIVNRMHKSYLKYMTKTVTPAIFEKEGFNETKNDFFETRTKNQMHLYNFSKHISTMVDQLQRIGLPPKAVAVGKAALQLWTIYPESSINPIDLHPSLASEEAKNDYLLPALEKLAPQFFPEVTQRVRRLIDVMYGAPPCT